MCAVEVWAYGSTGSGQSHGGSDLDLHGASFAEISSGQLVDTLPGTGQL